MDVIVSFDVASSLMDNQNTLQTVDRAIFFLEFVARAPVPPSIRDISEGLELNITTCYHLLRTLEVRGYVKRDNNGGLQLGDGVKALFDSYRKSQDIESYLAELVRRISAETMETSFLSIREDNSVVLKALVEGSRRLRVSGLYVGLQGQEYKRASGKVVLANLGDEARREMLESSVSNLPDRQRTKIAKSLEKQFPKIIAQGWASDEGQIEEGITSISAPIFSEDGSVFGAMGVVMPTFRLEKSEDHFLNIILNIATEASLLLKNDRSS